MKITFTGDLMCELPYYRQYKKHTMHFNEFYKDVKELWKSSDYVVANLETPLAGPEVGFTSSPFIFNTPDEFALAAYKAGVNVMTTANNHCMDRGITGLYRTLDTLDSMGILHTGTYRNYDESKKILKLKNDKTEVAIISCTYGTNASQNGFYFSDGNRFLVDSFDIERRRDANIPLLKRIKRSIQGKIPEETQINIKKALHLSWGLPKEDKKEFPESSMIYLEQICKKVSEAKSDCGFVIVCMHSGGQFNLAPGEYTRYVAKRLIEAGAELIVGNHPHIIQKSEDIEGHHVFYSLGNFCYSPNSCYIIKDHYPDYSILLHLDINEGKIERISYDLIKVDINHDGELYCKPIARDAQKKETITEYDDITNKLIRRINLCV